MSDNDTIEGTDAETETTTEEAAPKVTIGSAAQQAILDGADNNEALEAVLAVFPEAKTSLSSINWYRNNLRSKGEAVLTARELKKQRATTAADTADEAPAEEADPLA